MLRSLFAGVSGLRNHQIRLDAIGNNISNVNTTGYKGSRVTFQDVLYQTIAGASSPQGGRGGMNPKQVGLGVGVSSIDTIVTQGNIESTGRNTDMAIEGDGYFVVSDGGQSYYTRAGAFGLDAQGNLSLPGTGMRVMGWTPDASGVLDPNNALPGYIQIIRGQEMAPQATTSVEYLGNLDSRAATGDTVTTQKTIFDSQGNTHQLTIVFTKLNPATNPNEWTWTATSDAGVVDDGGAPAGPATGTVEFTVGGAYSGVTGATTVHISGIPGVADINITPDFDSLTQYGNVASANAGDQDGYSRGSLSEFSVDPRGVVTGYYSNGRSRPLAQVAMAVFNNPEGLTRAGNTLFQESNNSGTAQVGTALSGGRGVIKPGSLEMSNVDLSQEFTNLIITQRGFQASSRVITSSDEMLQELVNLKR